MRPALLSIVLFAGCGAPPSLDAPSHELPSAQAPLPISLDLALSTTANVGGMAELEVTGATPGARIEILLGQGGPGPGWCLPALGGQCLDVVGPYRRLVQLTADGIGRASLSFPIPATVPPDAYWLQAVEVAGSFSVGSPPREIEVFPACPSDPGEPNNDPSSASWPAPLAAAGTVCPGDPDWFRYVVPPGESISVFTDANSTFDGNVDVRLFDTGLQLLDEGRTFDDTDHASWINTTTQPVEVFAEVVATFDYDDDGVDYDIDVETRVPAPCVADALEPDSVLSQGLLTGSVYLADLTMCGNDSDWFVFDLATDEFVAVTALFSDRDVNIDLRAYSPSGGVMDWTAGSTDNEGFEVDSWFGAGTYALEVFQSGWGDGGPIAGGGAYDLSLLQQ